jgi:hypothetical protein
MSEEKKAQDARAKFYSTDSVIRHIKAVGIPKRTGEFKEMVAAGTQVKLESKEGKDLLVNLRRVSFAKHPQQINISDDVSGKILASIEI